jgi:glyoxylase-like metal-dependent hydrolase (beta-lactamase superfamily II)
MKRNIVPFVTILILLCVQNAFADLTKLSHNVYAYVGVKDASPAHSFAANAGIVIGDNGVLVVDTLMSAREGERFLADIRKVTDKPIRYVVNTHTHLDHALGNCVFAGLGATLISHEADRTALATQGEAILKHAVESGLTTEQLAGTRVVVPTLSFSERLTIDLGGEEVRLIRCAPSHTPGSLVVYLPGQKLLFSGDILFTDFHPYLADGDLPGWCKTIDTLLAMDIQRIVPGHGPLSTKQDLRDMREYLLLFDATATRLAATPLSRNAMAVELLKVLPRRSMAAWMVGYNLKMRYPGKK